MNILALDLGTHTGVALGRAGERPTLTTWEMPSGGGENVGPFIACFMDLLEGALEGVDLCIFERPFIAIRQHHSSPPFVQRDQVARAYGMAGVVEGFCARRSIACYDVVTVTLKKFFAGSGRANKADMLRAAKRRGFKPANDHEADAAACWLYAVAIKHPEEATNFEVLFAGSQT